MMTNIPSKLTAIKSHETFYKKDGTSYKRTQTFPLVQNKTKNQAISYILTNILTSHLHVGGKKLNGCISAVITSQNGQLTFPLCSESFGQVYPPEVKMDENGHPVYESSVSISKEKNSYKVTVTNNYKLVSEQNIFMTEIEKSDLCFGTVGSIYRTMDKGGTKDFFTHELFPSYKQAKEYLEKTKEAYLSFCDEYKVEAFSRKHISQMAWYQRSMDALIEQNQEQNEIWF